jgi:hypothetical protein
MCAPPFQYVILLVSIELSQLKYLTTDYFRGVASTKINESRKFSYESPTQLQYPYRQNPDITVGSSGLKTSA